MCFEGLSSGQAVHSVVVYGNARMYQALRDYGDRLDTVGIFTFEVDATGTISETGTSISSMMTYINRWKHIKWMLTVMNHGTASAVSS